MSVGDAGAEFASSWQHSDGSEGKQGKQQFLPSVSQSLLGRSPPRSLALNTPDEGCWFVSRVIRKDIIYSRRADTKAKPITSRAGSTGWGGVRRGVGGWLFQGEAASEGRLCCTHRDHGRREVGQRFAT